MPSRLADAHLNLAETLGLRDVEAARRLQNVRTQSGHSSRSLLRVRSRVFASVRVSSIFIGRDLGSHLGLSQKPSGSKKPRGPVMPGRPSMYSLPSSAALLEGACLALDLVALSAVLPRACSGDGEDARRLLRDR